MLETIFVKPWLTVSLTTVPCPLRAVLLLQDVRHITGETQCFMYVCSSTCVDKQIQSLHAGRELNVTWMTIL